MELPAEFLAHIEKNMNCEDIAMNLVVSSHLGKIKGRRMNSGIKVRLEGGIKMIEGENSGALYVIVIAPFFFLPLSSKIDKNWYLYISSINFSVRLLTKLIISTIFHLTNCMYVY